LNPPICFIANEVKILIATAIIFQKYTFLLSLNKSPWTTDATSDFHHQANAALPQGVLLLHPAL
jgi:hypothetical protein